LIGRFGGGLLSARFDHTHGFRAANGRGGGRLLVEWWSEASKISSAGDFNELDSVSGGAHVVRGCLCGSQFRALMVDPGNLITKGSLTIRSQKDWSGGQG